MNPFETETTEAITEEQARQEEAWWLDQASIAEYEAWISDMAESGDCFGEDGE